MSKSSKTFAFDLGAKVKVSHSEIRKDEETGEDRNEAVELGAGEIVGLYARKGDEPLYTVQYVNPDGKKCEGVFIGKLLAAA